MRRALSYMDFGDYVQAIDRPLSDVMVYAGASSVNAANDKAKWTAKSR